MAVAGLVEHDGENHQLSRYATFRQLERPIGLTMAGRSDSHDALVVGAGPNGLAAAITLARAGYSVLLREARDTCGGGVRSAEITLPGFTHDICSTVYPLAAASPFFRSLPLSALGLEWVRLKS